MSKQDEAALWGKGSRPVAEAELSARYALVNTVNQSRTGPQFTTDEINEIMALSPALRVKFFGFLMITQSAWKEIESRHED